MNNTRGHQHAEAFCLMTYTCDGKVTGAAIGDGYSRATRSLGCGHREVFWNSRDGVTPFAVSCPSCGGDLRHMHWQTDMYAPNHKPHYGQGVWRDGTPDEAEMIIRQRVEQMRGTQYTLSAERLALLIATVRNPNDPGNTEFRRGWPMLERHRMAGSAELARCARQMSAVWKGVQAVSPWSESNDMEWADEVLTGVHLLVQAKAEWIERAAWVARDMLRYELADVPSERDARGPKHLKWMAEQLAAKAHRSPTKACRWLGYLQGALVTLGYSTLEHEKARNKRSEEAAQ